MRINIPSSAWLTTRYCLAVNESSVYLVTWKRGRFTLVREFVNDNQGLQDASAFFKSRAALFANKSINICVSVIGEDYRFEKVAHLIGKYRSDMLKRRYQQLFRGTSYHTAIHQGREAIGRRQDYFLFCGVLSNEKIQPWVRELVRFNMNIAGIHLGSMLLEGINKHVIADKKGVNVVSVCSDKGFIRHNFYIDGHLRFSRLSRSGEEADADEIYRVVKGEIEKTSQYLANLKLIPSNSRVSAYVVAPDDLIDDLGRLAQRDGGDRITIKQVSARVVGNSLGIKRPISEFGRDVSLMAHLMATSLSLVQLASFDQIRYYVLDFAATTAITAAALFAVYTATGHGLGMFNAYGQFNEENSRLSTEIRQLSSDYDSQVKEFVQPPSTTENMRASVNVLNHVADISVGPGKLLLFFSNQFADAHSLFVDDIKWYVTNSEDGTTPGSLSYANGRKYFEVLQVAGQADPESDPEVALEEYKSLIRDIERRPDMTVVVQNALELVEAGGRLEGRIETDTNVKETLNAFTKTNFSFFVVWDQSYDPDAVEEEEEEA